MKVWYDRGVGGLSLVLSGDMVCCFGNGHMLFWESMAIDLFIYLGMRTCWIGYIIIPLKFLFLSGDVKNVSPIFTLPLALF